MLGNVYNINAGASFVDTLAERFLQKYGDKPEELAQVLFLLPTRRACQNLTDAFIRKRGLVPTVLPRILPIADVDEDEVFLTGHSELLEELSPQIDKTERSLIFTRLIMQKPDEWGLGRISLAQAYALAQNLADLIDLACNENLDFSRISDIVPAEYAVHWQETLKLLEIITAYWPQILSERGSLDVVERRNQLLKAEISLWKESKTERKIVVAGTTATFPLLKELVETVRNLPNGEVYLYGVDNCLDDKSWEDVDENHPQFELKELLDYLKISRSSLIQIGGKDFSPREMFVAEAMRPATSSAHWRQLSSQPISAEAFQGLQFVNCDDLRQEAQAIALIIRHTLQTREKTAALVTTDRNLARRVVSELKKWNITADDSAGQPLGLTPIGAYLRLIINVLVDNFSQISLLSLLKHPFTALGYSYGEFNKTVRRLEYAIRQKEELSSEQQAFLQKVRDLLQPLTDLYTSPQVDLAAFFKTHIEIAERLADTDIKSGEKIIWKGDAGAVAAGFVNEFLNKAPVLGSIATNDYAAFFDKLLQGKTVRVRYGMHPRVKILGPIEARLSQFDVTIIGEANEGSWPQIPGADLWMSRPMKKDFGLPSPEKAVGIMAADFAHLLNGKQVYLTRAERVDGTPTAKSRWWLRMETVLAAVFNEDKEEYAFLYDRKYSAWAKHLERADVLKRISAPKPKPKVELRPRKLSASGIEMLMRDPYSVFAKYILKLFPLAELDESLEYRDYGNIVHAVIERFNNKYNGQYPENARKELLQLGEDEFAAHNVSPDVRSFWWPRFVKTVDWLIDIETKYRPEVALVHNEIKGEMVFDAPAGKFTITAKADRIDETKTGGLNILDYKTGKIHSVKSIASGMAPQLPIEALIARNGGYPRIRPKPITSLRYWKLGEEEAVADKGETERAMERVYANIQQLISLFDFESTPYLAKPRPHIAPEYTDYEHLSRFCEWSVKEDADDE